jgi:hypothetical protein
VRGALWLALLVLVPALSVAADPNERLAAAAKRAKPGSYPRSWLGEPLYWTVVGAPGDEREALLSEDGALELGAGVYSIEPFLFASGTRIAARDSVRRQSLEEGDLPIPSVHWEHAKARLRVRAFGMTGTASDRAIFVSYRVENPQPVPASIELWLAVRPMQVLPAWQFLNLTPGFARIREIRLEGSRVRVNDGPSIEVVEHADAFGAAAPDDGPFVAALESGELPAATEARDPAGFAAGALVWRFALAPGASREVHLRLPTGPGMAALWPDPLTESGARMVQATHFDAVRAVHANLVTTVELWRRLLGRAEIDLPAAADDVERAARTALAHVLINRDGPRLQPGSRNYERSWIRDGALTSSALVQLGHADAARAFLEWYAPFQLANGGMPCCVDRRGADPTPEHDSNGAFLYALGEYARHTRDAAFVRSLWPRVVRVVAHLETLRAERLAPRFRTERGGATWGILPESISHEGYHKKPVHSYWDDLFARQGLRDAVFLAELVGDAEHAKAWSALSAAFERDLLASYEATRKLHGIPHLAGSVELGDFDPTATAVAFEMGGEPRDFPAEALAATFARYLGEIAERKRGVMKRDAYAPYEIRIATALVRMGQREDAWDVLRLMLDGRRPRAWNQWPEIVWTDEAKGQWLGDLPHSWIGSTFLHALRTALVYERASDQALVLAAGVPAAWLASEGPLRVARLSTWWGPLDYELRRAGPGALRMRVSGGLSVPPGGVVLAPPGVAPVTVRELPAELVLGRPD